MSFIGSARDLASAALQHKLIKVRINDYAAYAKLTLLMYEIVINLGREVKLVWSTSFRWSNVIYFMNRYPVVAFQLWSVCYTTSTPQPIQNLNLGTSCDALYQFFWYASFIPTRAAITASFALRVYAIMEGGLVFVVILSVLGMAIVGLDIWQGVQSSCTESSNQLSTITTFVFLACFDVLSTVLVTIRMIKTIRWSGGFRALDSQHIAGYILRSAIALYFGLYSLVLNNLMLVLSSIMVARFLLDLREMNNGKVVVNNTIAASVSLSNTMPFEVAANPALSTSGDHRAKPRRRRGHHGFDDTSLFQDFADHENYTDSSSNGTSEITMTHFSGKEDRRDAPQLNSTSRPLEDLIVRAKVVEEALDSNDEINVENRH
ncbi:hypothetical protein BT96DRAFT_931551 [Gymnopus androsaceus JB14]|uniref:DUF6533 domain-containing protein n=1 Tax=Gymnopus androsaceus JB14 TaxID=1447944 RepID=A0A6A4IHJ0_9AGAR|nr:hypothetical protein BT96DRAFT_931551 [Gymnopus androsaceus JB14]